jgi:RNA polymerase sigma-70 factor (ECF subfamily)
MCHHHADAADLTQATFLRALEALPTFENRARFFTWLFRIAVNLTLSQRRQHVRRASVSLDQSAQEEGRGLAVVAHEQDAASTAEQRELHERVGRALAQLDEEFRVAVILKDIEDLDYATIAEILAVPIGTVKSRIHRGRQALRELLRDERTSVARS